MRKLLSFCILVLTLGGCVSNNSEITVLLKPLKDKATLEPSLVRFSLEYYYLDNMTIRLVELEANGTYANSLAERIIFSNNKKDLTIKIKEAYFSNGDRVTSSDVVNSFKRVILKGSPHSNPKGFIRGAKQLSNLSDEIEGLKVISPDTLSIGLTGQMKELYYYLQLADYGILHSTQYTKDKLTTNDWLSVTSGPYKLDLSNNDTVLIANLKTLKASEQMPQKVKMKHIEDDSKIIEAMKNERVHFGLLSFKTYSQNIDTFKSVNSIDYYGSKTGGIIYLSLNPKSKKFKSESTRQWLNKKVQELYKLTQKQKEYMQKANQYFLPEAKGHISQENINTILKEVKTDYIPQELKDGITIKTVEGMKNYIPSDLKENLSKILGIPVSFDFSVTHESMITEMGERNFDAFIMASSMSYKVIGETLNLVYTSKSPMFIDPTGKIHKLLENYQATDNTTEETEIITQILRQMTTDSECVPIAYFAGPKFYNKNVLDASNMLFEESFQFWRLRVN